MIEISWRMLHQTVGFRTQGGVGGWQFNCVTAMCPRLALAAVVTKILDSTSKNEIVVRSTD